MSAVCPNGHTSESDDYCDTCGSPIDASAQPAAASPAPVDPLAPGGKSSLDLDPEPEPGTGDPNAPTGPVTLSCPNCQTENAEGALFCEACGYDFTTGAMPRDPSAGPPDESDEGDGDGGGEVGGEVGGDGGGDGAHGTDPGPSPDGPDAAADPNAGLSGDPSDDDSRDPAPAAGAAAAPSPAASGFDWLAEVWVDPDWYQTQEAEDPCPSPGLPTIMPLRHRSVLLGRVSSSKNTNPEIDLSSDPGVSRRHAQLTTDGTRWFVEDLGSSNGTFVGPASGPLPATAINVGPKTELDDDDRLYVGAWTRVVVRRATPDEVEAYA